MEVCWVKGEGGWFLGSEFLCKGLGIEDRMFSGLVRKENCGWRGK